MKKNEKLTKRRPWRTVLTANVLLQRHCYVLSDSDIIPNEKPQSYFEKLDNSSRIVRYYYYYYHYYYYYYYYYYLYFYYSLYVVNIIVYF